MFQATHSYENSRTLPFHTFRGEGCQFSSVLQETRAMQDDLPSVSELVGDIHPALQWEVVDDFANKTLDDIHHQLDTVDCNWMLEGLGKMQGRGFQYYFPVFADYAKSERSEDDVLFPGSFAMAIELQIMNRPEGALKISSEIRSITDYMIANIGKYGQGPEWAESSLEIYNSILCRLDKPEEKS